MPMTEDFGVFFDLADFADAATLDGVALNGIFDNAYAEGLEGLSSREPRFRCAESAATQAATIASVLVLRGINYRVRSVQPDGTGTCVLWLERP